MSASDNVLKRYALAYIKKSGNSNNIEGFLQHCNTRNITDWSDGNFENVYGEFTRLNSNNEQNTRNRSQQHNVGNNTQPAGPQVTHVYVHNRGLDFWDYNVVLTLCLVGVVTLRLII